MFSMFFVVKTLNKMRLLLIFISLFVCISLHAQEGFSAATDRVLSTGGNLSYALGQVVYTTYTNNTGSVAQGVQQTYDIIALLGTEIATIKLELLAYPNPTQEVLNLKIDNYKNESLTYQIYDFQGKLLDSQPIKTSENQIDMKNLAMGKYLLSIQEKETLIKTFRIIKN